MLAKPRAPRGHAPAGYRPQGQTATTVPMSTLRQRREIQRLLKHRGLPTRYVTDEHADALASAGVAAKYGDLIEQALRAVSYRTAQRLINALQELRHAQA